MRTITKRPKALGTGITVSSLFFLGICLGPAVLGDKFVADQSQAVATEANTNKFQPRQLLTAATPGDGDIQTSRQLLIGGWRFAEHLVTLFGLKSPYSDHSGGARAFMAEGATILTTPSNSDFFEKMGAANYTLKADRFARSPRPVKIETFQKKRTITDGVRTVELINIGRNPHSSENVVLYIPAEKILFQGDLFYFDPGQSFPPKNRTVIMSFFAKWLKDNNLAPERIYSVHSHGFATMDHVRQVVQKPTWIGSVPPAVAGGSTLSIQNQEKYRILIIHPPATAGGTDPIQARSRTFEGKRT